MTTGPDHPATLRPHARSGSRPRRGSIWTRELFPTPVWAYPLLLGCLTCALCRMFDAKTIGIPEVIFVGILATGLWTSVNWVIRRRIAREIAVVPLCVAVILISVSIVAVFVRTGQNDSSLTGYGYWTTLNDGYRFNPRWAIRPLWGAPIGFLLYSAILITILLRRRR